MIEIVVEVAGGPFNGDRVGVPITLEDVVALGAKKELLAPWHIDPEYETHLSLAEIYVDPEQKVVVEKEGET